MRNNKIYKLYLTDSMRKNVFVGNWIGQKCAEEEAKHYLKLYAHSMRIEVLDTESMQVINVYEITRQGVA